MASACDVYSEVLAQLNPGPRTLHGSSPTVTTKYRRVAGPAGAFNVKGGLAPIEQVLNRCAQQKIALSGWGHLSELGTLGAEVQATPPARLTADQAANAVLELVRQYGIAVGKVGFSDFVQAMNPIDWALGTKDVADPNRRNLITLGKYIADWSTARMRWAVNGKRDDNTAYDWSRWAAEGKEYAKSAQFYGGVAVSALGVNTLLDTVVETARQANPANPKAWPTWLKVLVGAGAVVAVAYVANTAIKTKRELFNPVRGEFTHGMAF